jgi:hypothetical protein
VINEWGQETGIFIPAFLSTGEPGNLAVCLTGSIHSRKALKQTLSLHAGTTGIQLLWKRCLPSKDPTYSTKIKIEQLTKLKTMVKSLGWKGA